MQKLWLCYSSIVALLSRLVLHSLYFPFPKLSKSIHGKKEREEDGLLSLRDVWSKRWHIKYWNEKGTWSWAWGSRPLLHIGWKSFQKSHISRKLSKNSPKYSKSGNGKNWKRLRDWFENWVPGNFLRKRKETILVIFNHCASFSLFCYIHLPKLEISYERSANTKDLQFHRMDNEMMGQRESWVERKVSISMVENLPNSIDVGTYSPFLDFPS